MTPEDEPKSEGADDEDEAMAALLKRSFAAKGASPAPSKEILRGVQRRIRTRSRGKFYGDGWSTSGSRVSPMAIAAAMLIVIAIAYFALSPMGISAR